MPATTTPESTFRSALFPLPADVIATHLETYSTFSDPEISFLVRSNNVLADPADPVLHSLEFLEDPALAPWQHVSLPGVSYGPELQFVATARAKEFAAMRLRSRIGTCIGAAILRGRMRQLADDGRPSPLLRADPGRHYLTLPEPANKTNFLRARLHPHHDQKTFDYISAFMGEDYFADAESAADVLALYEAWQESPACTMFSAAITSEQHFGDICHAMMNLFRLQRILEHEEWLAPRNQNVYDPQKHFVPATINHATGQTAIGVALVDAEPWMEMYCRPIAGHATVANARAAAPGVRFGYEHWGDGRVARGEQLARVSRALARYVRFDVAHPEKLMKVGIRASVEHFDLTDGNAVVVAYDDGSFVDLRCRETLRQDGHVRFFCGNDRIETLTELPAVLDDAESEAVVMALQAW